MLACVVTDGSVLSNEAFFEIAKEEGFNMCLVKAGINRGFIVSIHDGDDEIRAGEYFSLKEMLDDDEDTTGELPKKEWKDWC